MASSFLVPFTLHVKRSELCKSLHEELGPLLSLSSGEKNPTPKSAPLSAQPLASSHTLQYLLEDVVVPVPKLDPLVVSNDAVDFVSAARHSFKFEQRYVRLVFQEYCRRKNIEKESESALDECRKLSQELLDAELPLDVRESLADMEAKESEARENVEASYKCFVEWVEATTPQWLEAVQCLEEERRAKAAAVDEVKRALENELALRNDASPADEAHGITDESLRRQAIAMIEQEQERHLKTQEERVNMLRQQEEHLRWQIGENRRRSEAEKERHHEDEIELKYKFLMDQESSLQSRLAQYEEARMQREEERKMLLEHIEAEEQLLRRRLEERELQRKKAEEEKERMEREQREALYEHIEVEEELLRQRLQRYEEARVAEASMAKKREEEGRAELYEHVRAEEEILRQRLERRRKEEEAEKERRQREEEERQRETLLKALAEETSALEERMRRREAESHQLMHHPHPHQQYHQHQHYQHVLQQQQQQGNQLSFSVAQAHYDPTFLNPLQPAGATAVGGAPGGPQWVNGGAPPPHFQWTHGYPNPQVYP